MLSVSLICFSLLIAVVIGENFCDSYKQLLNNTNSPNFLSFTTFDDVSGLFLIFSDSNQNIKIYDGVTFSLVREFQSGHSGKINSIIQAGKDIIATAGDDNTVLVRNFKNLNLTTNFTQHAASVIKLGKFPGENNLVISGDSGGNIHLWDSLTGIINNTITFDKSKIFKSVIVVRTLNIAVLTEKTLYVYNTDMSLWFWVDFYTPPFPADSVVYQPGEDSIYVGSSKMNYLYSVGLNDIFTVKNCSLKTTVVSDGIITLYNKDRSEWSTYVIHPDGTIFEVYGLIYKFGPISKTQMVPISPSFSYSKFSISYLLVPGAQGLQIYNFTLGNDASFYNGKCYLSGCPNGSYSINQGIRKCLPCNPLCETCSGPNSCTTCVLASFGGKCLVSCPKNSHNNGSSIVCQCDDGYYKADDSCLDCGQLNCRNKCNGFGCSSCDNGYYMNWKSTPQSCFVCSSSCKSCNSINSCSECHEDFYLKNGDCLAVPYQTAVWKRALGWLAAVIAANVFVVLNYLLISYCCRKSPFRGN